MYNIIACAIIKDEHNYIEEWVEWHHDYVGIEHIFLIEDITSKPHDELLAKYDYVTLYKLGDIINEEEKGFFKIRHDKVYIAYKIFYRVCRPLTKWMAFIDADEFIDYPKDKLYKVLDSQSHKPCITMQWLYMKCDGHIKHPNNWQKYSLIDIYHTYTTVVKFKERYKQILNCDKKFDELCEIEHWAWFPHTLDVVFNNFKGNIKIKHFMTKSFEEFVYRLQKRGECAQWKNRMYDNWFEINQEYRDKKEEIYKMFDIKSELDNVKYTEF